jgi:ribosomal protein L14
MRCASARISDRHIKEAAPDGQIKKGEVHDAVIVRTRFIASS